MWLNALTWLIGYRFRIYLRPELRLPFDTPESVKGDVGVKEIKEKARASSAVAGVFLAFSVTFLVALIGTQELGSILKPLGSDKCTFALVFLGMSLPYLILREERRISAARVEAHEDLAAKRATSTGTQQLNGNAQEDAEESRRGRHYVHLAMWSVLCLATLVLGLLFPSGWRLAVALPLSGLFLIVASTLLLVLSVEFYDTAGSWQAAKDERYHFHMASIASHCYLFGLSLGLVGVSLSFCGRYPRTGYAITTIVLLTLVAMTEIERELYRLHKS
jgi:hypothetical protein